MSERVCPCGFAFKRDHDIPPTPTPAEADAEMALAGAALAQLRELARAAIAVIHQWHGDAGWREYLDHSPEMQPFREVFALDAITGAKDRTP